LGVKKGDERDVNARRPYVHGDALQRFPLFLEL
jgi:hypothetical protein